VAGLSDGVLILDKPSGPTSHDVVSGVRRVYQTRSVGHAGTLDPMATGVLVVLLGEATKLSSYLTQAQKSYRATITFGRSTDTLDAEGETEQVVELASDWLEQNRERIEPALDRERARIEQVPPVVSAIQVGGERAHRAARRGAPPVLDPRAVHVDRLDELAVTGNELTLELDVSKGYYVRSLARDLGESIGMPAHLSALRRIASGAFRIEAAHVWPLAAPVPLLPLEDAARLALPVAELLEAAVKRTRSGQPLGVGDFTVPPADAGVSAWMSPEGRLVALGETRDGTPTVVRGFKPPG
jgi:tRNA pseudouridine55 synthase